VEDIFSGRSLAPVLFIVFHFYLLIQLILLSRTVSAFDTALDATKLDEVQRNTTRMRLDNSVFVQIIAGAEPERRGRNYIFIVPMAWLTIIVGHSASCF
jgi:hypothetical protein